MNVFSDTVNAEVPGMLLVDKPAGITSYDVIRQLKRRFFFQK